MCIKHFDHNHLIFPKLFQDPPTLPVLFLASHHLKRWPTEFNMFHPWAIHGTMVDLPGSTLYQKTNLPLLRSNHISIAAQLGIGGSWAHSNSMQLRVHRFSIPVMSRRNVFAVPSRALVLQSFCPLSLDVLQGLRAEVCIAALFVAEQFTDIYSSSEIFIQYC